MIKKIKLFILLIKFKIYRIKDDMLTSEMELAGKSQRFA